jgi:hypothetical protein
VPPVEVVLPLSLGPGAAVVVAVVVVVVALGVGDAVVSFPAEQPVSRRAGTARRGRSRFMIPLVPPVDEAQV